MSYINFEKATFERPKPHRMTRNLLIQIVLGNFQGNFAHYNVDSRLAVKPIDSDFISQIPINNYPSAIRPKLLQLLTHLTMLLYWETRSL